MAIRNDLIQSRSAYIGSSSSVSPSVGNLVVDGNVGIGTTSPGDKLTVNGNISIFSTNKIYNGASADSAGIFFPNSTTRIDGFNGITFHSSATNVGSQSERMRITNAGDVGIGTTSPGGKLEVFTGGTSGWDKLVVTNTTLWGDGSTPFVTIGAGGATGIMIANPHIVWNSSANAAALRMGRSGGVSSGAWFEIGTGASDSFFISRNGYSSTGTAQIFISSSNYVGIGTTSPGALLAVGTQSSGSAGSGVAANNSIIGRFGAANTASRVVGLTIANTATATIGNDSTLSFIVAGNYSATGLISTILQDTGTAASDMVFSLFANTLQERMRIQGSTGNVGIGTTSPGYKLTVAGNSYFGDTIYNGGGFISWTSGFGDGTTQTYYGNSLAFLTNSSSYTARMFITSAGNVGIGTTNPQTKLHLWSGIAGNNIEVARFTSAYGGTGDGPLVRFTNYLSYASNPNAGEYNLAGIRAYDFASSWGGALQFLTAVNNGGGGDLVAAMTIDSSQKVGIGTTSPRSILHVSGTLSYGSIRISPTSNNGESTMAFFSDAAGTDENDSWVIGQGGWGNTGDFVIGNENNGAGGNVRLLIEKSGNVGIGTSSPSSRLDVNGDIRSQGIFRDYQGEALLQTTPSAVTELGSTGAGTPRTLAFLAGNTERMRITTAGNVGIGTSSPANKLQVQHGNIGLYSNSYGSTGLIRIFGTDSAEKFQMGLTTGGDSYLYTFSGNNLIFYTNNGSERMRIAANGNVGIGNTDPAVKLAVSGVTSTGNRKLSLGILDINVNLESQIRINTTIPFASGGADFTVNIKGFRYGVSQMVSLSIGWHYYLGSFYNETAISNGAWKPTISLARDANGYVVIYLPAPEYWAKLYVESVYSSNYGDAYSSGWTWTNEDLSNCTNIEVVPYQSLATNITGSSASTSAVSGTTNYVSKFTSSNTIGNSLIYDNGTNVGIGTTSPNDFGGSFKVLDVKGNTGGYILSTNSDNSTIAQMGVGSNISYYGTRTNADVVITTNNTERMRITTTGNLLVGTTTNLGADINANSSIRVGVAFGTKASIILGDSGTPYWEIFRPASSGNLRISSYALNAVEIQPTTGNVGIGTTSPGYKLDVTGDARFGDGNNFNPLIQFAGSGRVATSPGYSFVGDLDTGMFNPNLGNTLAFSTAGAERIRITSDGNVGIGTTAPTSKLTVDDSTAFSWGFPSLASAKIGTPGTGGSFVVMTPSLNSSYESGFAIDGTYTGGKSVININAFGVYSGGPYSADIAFKTSTNTTLSEKMRITSSGNVGIGTTNPYSPLQVGSYTGSGGFSYGTAATFVSSFNSVRATLFVGSTDTTSTQDKGGSIDFGGGSEAGSTPYTYARIKGYKEVAGGGYSGYLSFSTTPAGSDANTERMRINSSGQVLIGTTTAQSGTRLQVAGVLDVWSSSNTLLRFAHDSTKGIIESFTGGGYANTVINPNLGNVGIGTSSPSTKLHVQGTSDTRIMLSDTGGASIQLYQQATDSYILSTNATRIYTGGSERITITSGGNVGIGTTSPSYKLDVNGSGGYYNSINGNFVSLTLSNINAGSGARNILQFTNDAGNVGSIDTFGSNWAATGGGDDVADGFRILAPSSGGLSLRASTSTIRFYTGSSERMRITSSGNVGIGTTSPSYKLDVVGNIRLPESNYLYLGDTSNFITKNNLGVVTLAGSSSVYINAFGSPRLAVTGSGDIGMGTTSPDVKLHVVGTSFVPTTMKLVHSQAFGAPQTLSLSSNSTGVSSLELSYANPFSINIGGTEMMRIAANGDVGIGTNNPTSKLSVAGIMESLATSSVEGGQVTLRAGSSYNYRWNIDNYADSFRIFREDDPNSANGYVAFFMDQVGTVGLNTTSPARSAILDLTATNRGFLPPRMTNTQMNNIASPATGLIVYDTTNNKVTVYNGSGWVPLH